MNLGIVVATLGRIDSLRRLLGSLQGRLTSGDCVVLVAQGNPYEVRKLAAEYRNDNFCIDVIGSQRGATRGRNAGVKALPTGIDYLLVFPNDTTWFPVDAIEKLRCLPVKFTTGAMTVVDANGVKFRLPEQGASLNRWNVWSVIEMGLIVRRSTFDSVNGFDPDIGTGAETPWQAGEATDLLLKLKRAGLTKDFGWQPPTLNVGGITDAQGLSQTERRHKLRGYGRGLGRLVTRWNYPLWWRIAFIGGGIAFGIRHHTTNELFDGWWVFLGRLEGALGHTLGRPVKVQAVQR